MAWRWMLVLGVASTLACDAKDVDTMSTEIREGDPCEEQSDSVPCMHTFDEQTDREHEREGIRYCDRHYEGGASAFEMIGPSELKWGACVTSHTCELGDRKSCGIEGVDESCVLIEGVPQWSGCNTPLVLSFDGGPVHMDPAPAASFDIMDAGRCVSTDWPTVATPWLALDRNGDGLVETGAELFGSGTRMADGRHAHDGFEALSTLDSNGDGRISAADERFDELVLWSDADRDKRGTTAEFEALSARGILSIELDYEIDPHCDERGNCEIERARFRFIDGRGTVGRGEVIDVHLACR